MRHLTIRVIALLVLAASVVPVGANRARNTSTPIVVSVGGGVVTQGQTVDIKVGMSEPVQGYQQVSIQSSTPANWSTLPATVTLSPGSSSITFQATVCDSAAGSVEVSASCNGGKASGSATVIPLR